MSAGKYWVGEWALVILCYVPGMLTDFPAGQMAGFAGVPWKRRQADGALGAPDAR